MLVGVAKYLLFPSCCLSQLQISYKKNLVRKCSLAVSHQENQIAEKKFNSKIAVWQSPHFSRSEQSLEINSNEIIPCNALRDFL